MNIIDQKRSGAELRSCVRKRIQNMRELASRKGVDVTIIARPENLFYFSNFNPIITSHAPFFIITKYDAVLLVHSIRRTHAVNEGAVDRVLCYGKWGSVQPLAAEAIDAIYELLGDQCLTVGVEGDYASMNFLGRLRSALNVREFVDIAPDAASLRLIKDFHEIHLCRISGELVDLGVAHAIAALERGASEAQASTEGQCAMRQRWHEKYQHFEVSGFSSSETADMDTLSVWCVSNERLNYGCDCPSGYVPIKGDLTMPMSWAHVGGYSVENERSVIVGSVSPERTRAYDAMLRARERIFQMLRPGISFEALYCSAMKEFEEAGFGNILPGRCGHGMGLSSHEYPSLTSGNGLLLAPGMVFSVEPGLMDDQLGAVRHSDTVLITQDGFEFLTNFPRDKLVIKA